MTKVVGVRFSDTGKTYYFDPKGLDIKNGDEIIVETANGLEFGKASCGCGKRLWMICQPVEACYTYCK